MSDLIGVHFPYCNINCEGDDHWFTPEAEALIDQHTHSDEQGQWCAACRDGLTA